MVNGYRGGCNTDVLTVHENVLLDLGALLHILECLVQRGKLGFDKEFGEADKLEVRLELQILEHGVGGVVGLSKLAVELAGRRGSSERSDRGVYAFYSIARNCWLFEFVKLVHYCAYVQILQVILCNSNGNLNMNFVLFVRIRQILAKLSKLSLPINCSSSGIQYFMIGQISNWPMQARFQFGKNVRL